MTTRDKRDFLVPGGALRGRVLSRMLEEIDVDDLEAQAEPSHCDVDNALIGSWIGPYHILRLLGAGGMGAVYLATQDDSGIRRQVALKLLRDVPRHGVVKARFERERRILARVAHANIAHLYDSGENALGVPYYTMEYVEGEPITSYCSRADLPIASRIRLLLGVAAALSAAHRHLIIHRDIKPSNVMVNRDGQAKLLDFGIAKFVAEDSESDVTQTAMGPMTPQYAAPEQFRGDPLTIATDVYQFGVLMFRVLAGCLPFRADPHDSMAWARAVSDEEPLRLRHAARRMESDGTASSDTNPMSSSNELSSRVARGLRGDLDAIVRKALAKDPEQRYPSMDAFKSDLEAYLEGRPVAAKRAGLSYRTRRFIRRNRPAIAVAGIAALALAAGAWFAVNNLRIERDRAAAAAARANATSEFLVGLFAVADPGENRGERLTANQILARGAQQLAERQGSDASTNAAVALEIGKVYLSLGEFARAKAVVKSALSQSAATLPTSSPLTSRLLLAQGWVSYLMGDYAASEQDYAKAQSSIALIADPTERTLEESSLAHRQSTLLRRRGKLDEADAYAHRALDLATAAAPGDELRRGPIWNGIGIIERDRGDHKASIAAYQHALDIYRAKLGELHPFTLGASANLAEILMFDDKEERAEALLTASIEGTRKLQDGPSTMLANSLNLLSQVRLDQGRYQEAADLATESDEIYRTLLGPDHNFRAFPLVHLGHARLGLNDGPGAIGAFTLALELRRRAFGEEHADTANALRNLAEAHYKLGHPAEAERLYREALAIRTRVLPAGHVALPRTRLEIVAVLLDAKRTEEARTELARANDEYVHARDVLPKDREKLQELMARAAVLAGDEK